MATVKTEDMIVPWGWIATIGWTVFVILFIVRLVQKAFPKPPTETQRSLADLKQKYRNEGCPTDFYISDEWFDWIFKEALAGQPDIRLFRDDQGVWVPFEHSRLRPESSRGKGGWIGFDLDGTIAHYEDFEGAGIIGKPIQNTIAIMRRYLESGIECRILTARISPVTHMRGEIDLIDYSGHIEAVTAAKAIWTWLAAQGLPRLVITARTTACGSSTTIAPSRWSRIPG